MDEPVSFDS